MTLSVRGRKKKGRGGGGGGKKIRWYQFTEVFSFTRGGRRKGRRKGEKKRGEKHAVGCFE